MLRLCTAANFRLLLEEQEDHLRRLIGGRIFFEANTVQPPQARQLGLADSPLEDLETMTTRG